MPCLAMPSTLHILSQVFHLTHCLFLYIYIYNIYIFALCFARLEQNVFFLLYFCSALLFSMWTGWMDRLKAGWCGVAAILEGLRFFWISILTGFPFCWKVISIQGINQVDWNFPTPDVGNDWMDIWGAASVMRGFVVEVFKCKTFFTIHKMFANCMESVTYIYCW